MSTDHYALPVGEKTWSVPGAFDTTFQWDYDDVRGQLLTLYGNFSPVGLHMAECPRASRGAMVPAANARSEPRR